MSTFIKYLNVTFTVLVLQENKRQAHRADLHAHLPLLLTETTTLTFPPPPWVIKWPQLSCLLHRTPVLALVLRSENSEAAEQQGAHCTPASL